MFGVPKGSRPQIAKDAPGTDTGRVVLRRGGVHPRSGSEGSVCRSSSGRLIAQSENLERTMIPQVPTALAILLMAASLAPQTPQGSDPGRFVTGGRIIFRLEPYRGPTCELTVHVDVRAASNGRRSVALSCESRGAHRTLITDRTDPRTALWHTVQIGVPGRFSV